MSSKSRFSSLDVRRAVSDLRGKVLGLRVANVYDLNKKTYLLKVVRPDLKAFIVIESGVRLHSTIYSRDKSDVPSIFAMKLRKLIRTKRVESIEQYGMDRVVDFTFGSGELTCHLIVEFYAAGNLVLTDRDYKIVALLRSYQLTDGTNVTVGSTYPTDIKQPLEELTQEKVEAIITAGAQNKSIKNALSMKIPYGNEVVEHCLLKAGITPGMKLSAFDRTLIPLLVVELKEAYKFITSTEVTKGYIVAEKVDLEKEKKKATDQSTEADKDGAEEKIQAATITSDGLRYTDFLPFKFKQFEAEPYVKEFKDFDEAVDEYYSKLYAQKVHEEKVEHDRTVDKRLEKVRRDQEARVSALEANEKKFERYALLLEQNVDMVDRCILAVNVAISQQVDWTKLALFIKEQKNNGDPLSLMIHKLKLEENKITLLLYDTYLADDAQTEAAETVDVDLSLTAHANATTYFAERKKAGEKREKTIGQASKALESAEKKAEVKMKETKVKQLVKQIRKPYWFEKFYFFISSDNYIIVAGRDAQQNELLYRRYLQSNDIYFHADLHGASSVIVKNPDGKPLPPFTLAQASTFALCHSGAWKNKVVTSAYWVHANQVSKTAPSGEYLNTGGFMIRGKKNMMSPSQLVLGLGLLFRVADESLVNHVDERKPKFFDSEESAHSIGKGDAQPKSGWQPKNKAKKEEDAEDQEEEEDDDEESDELANELRNSDFKVSLVREEAPAPAVVATAPVLPAPVLDEKEEVKKEEEKNTAAAAKKKMSAHERRQLKKKLRKGGEEESDEKEEEGTDEEEESGSESEEEDEGEDEGPKQKGPVPVQHKRGQKSKLKKMKKKYGWQDEEDRRVHMQLLGHKVEERGAKDGEEAGVPEGEAKKEVEKGGKMLTPEEKKARENKRLRFEREEEEIRMLMKDEKLDSLTDEQKSRMEELTAQMSGVNLSALTGRPVAGDILLYAIPVCGPYEALKDFKFKVKLVPGGDKKGHMARTVVNIFLNNPDSTEQERDLIKTIPETEITTAMITDCKLSNPGAAGKGGKKGRGGRGGKGKK